MRTAVVLMIVSGCGRFGFELASRDADATARDADRRDAADDATPPDTDGALPDAADVDAQVPLRDFGAPTVVGGLADPAANDDDPTLTADLLEIFFTSDRLGIDDIWTARRTTPTAGWDTPTRVMVSSATDDEGPGVSPDGLTLYFTSYRAGGSGGYSIWVATRPDRDPATPWSTPILSTGLSSVDDDYQAQPDTSGAPWLVMHRRASGVRDLYYTSTSDSGLGPPNPILGVNSADNERGPCMTAIGLELFFASDRALGTTNDLFFAMRTSSDHPFDPATPVSALNSADDEDDPWVSADRRVIFFASDRSGDWEIYEARR